MCTAVHKPHSYTSLCAICDDDLAFVAAGDLFYSTQINRGACSMRLRAVLLAALVGCTGNISGNNGSHADAGADSKSNSSGSDAAANTGSDAAPAITVLRGVDRAGAFSITEATALETTYSVQWTGVYIGGPCSAGSGWTQAVVSSLATQLGWTFMPIYVGQQTSSICGRDTVTAAQGTTDGQAAAALMATFGWQANHHIPICLDLEGGTYSAEATNATAYAEAWRNAVRSAGYLAYVYSSPDGINGMVTAGVTFDGAWPAAWQYTGFEDVSPSDLTDLGSNYASSNRAWQYAGSFTTNGGGQVDGDTSDLLLAPAP